MKSKAEVVEILNKKGFQFNGKEYERMKGSKVISVSLSNKIGKVFVWDSKNNRVFEIEFKMMESNQF